LINNSGYKVKSTKSTNIYKFNLFRPTGDKMHLLKICVLLSLFILIGTIVAQDITAKSENNNISESDSKTAVNKQTPAPTSVSTDSTGASEGVVTNITTGVATNKAILSPLEECILNCPPENYADCKEKCYQEIEGSDSCIEECDANGKCKTYCKIKPVSISSVKKPVPVSSVKKPVPVSSVKKPVPVSSVKKPVPTSSGQKVVTPIAPVSDNTASSSICGKVCKKDEQGNVIACEELCTGQTTSENELVVQVEQTSEDIVYECISTHCSDLEENTFNYNECKNKCYHLYYGEENCKEVCETNSNGTLVNCVTYCDIEAGNAITKPIPALVLKKPVDDLLYQCIIETCQDTGLTGKDYAACKKECYNNYGNVIAPGSTPSPTPAPIAQLVASPCARFKRNSSITECLRQQEIEKRKNKCLALLEKEEREKCIQELEIFTAGNEVADYKVWKQEKGQLNTEAWKIKKQEKEQERKEIKQEFQNQMQIQITAIPVMKDKKLLEDSVTLIEQAEQRNDILEQAITKAEEKGHDVSDLEYLSEKYLLVLDNGKALYMQGNFKEGMKKIKESEKIMHVFKNTLKKVVQENKVGLLHQPVIVSPLAVTAVETD